LVDWITSNFSEGEILRLFHDLDKYVHFTATDKELLESDVNINSLITETPREIVLNKLKEIKTSLNLPIET